jgi:hypothetical protein
MTDRKGHGLPPKSVSLGKLEHASKPLSVNRVRELFDKGVVTTSQRGRKSEYQAYLEAFRDQMEEDIRDITSMKDSWVQQLGTFVPKVWEGSDYRDRPTIVNLQQEGRGDLVLLVKRTIRTMRVPHFRSIWEVRDKQDETKAKEKPIPLILQDPNREARTSDPHKGLR